MIQQYNFEIYNYVIIDCLARSISKFSNCEYEIFSNFIQVFQIVAKYRFFFVVFFFVFFFSSFLSFRFFFFFSEFFRLLWIFSFFLSFFVFSESFRLFWVFSFFFFVFLVRLFWTFSFALNFRTQMNRISFLLWNYRDMIRDNSSLISKNYAKKHMIQRWLFFNQWFFFLLSKNFSYVINNWIIKKWFFFTQFFEKSNHRVWKIIYFIQMIRTSSLRAFDFFIICLFQVTHFSLNWQETMIFAILFKSRHQKSAIIVEFINHWLIFSIELQLTIDDDCISIVDTKSIDEIKCETSKIWYRYYVKLWILFW